jgi:hypothetical protein
MTTMDATKVPLTLRLLGPWEARVHGAPLPHLRDRKGAWLLALLTLRPGHGAERAWLAGLLWPDSLHAQALANLRKSHHPPSVGTRICAGRSVRRRAPCVRPCPAGRSLRPGRWLPRHLVQ